MVFRESRKSNEVASPSMGCFTLSQTQGKGALTLVAAIAGWGSVVQGSRATLGVSAGICGFIARCFAFL